MYAQRQRILGNSAQVPPVRAEQVSPVRAEPVEALFYGECPSTELQGERFSAAFSLRRQSREQGFILVVGLVMLVLVMLLSMAAMKATTLQGRMAGSAVDQNQAFQAAESTLRQGELRITHGMPRPALGTHGQFNAETTPAPRGGALETLSTWRVVNNYLDCTDPAQWGGDAAGSRCDMDWTGHKSAMKPRYMIEQQPNIQFGKSAEVGKPLETEVFKVTALGSGSNRDFDGSASSVVIVQSTLTH